MGGETFRERPSERPQVETRAPTPVPAERQMHSSIDVLSISASNLRITSESTYRSPSEAELASRIARNVSELRLEGSAPLVTRLSQLVRTLG